MSKKYHHRQELLSYYQFLFPVLLTELLRRATFLLLEDSVEIRQIVKATAIGNLCDGSGGVH